MKIIYLMNKRHLNNYLNRSCSNQCDSSDSSWCDLNRSDSKLQNFCAQLLNFKTVLALGIFENAIVSRVFTFNFRCAMPRCAPAGEILFLFVEVDEAPNVYWWNSITTIILEFNSSTTLHTGNLWYYASDGSWWVHKDAVIHVPPKVHAHFVTNLLTLEGDAAITMDPSINRSARLVPVPA